MTVVTVSPKYQIVIPETVRKQLGIRPGQKLEAMADGDQVVLAPHVGIADARGMLAGLPDDFRREKTDRRL